MEGTIATQERVYDGTIVHVFCMEGNQTNSHFCKCSVRRGKRTGLLYKWNKQMNIDASVAKYKF